MPQTSFAGQAEGAMRHRLFGILFLLAYLVFPLGLQPHGGRTDSLGCHHNRKTEGYHCHSGPLAGKSFSSKAKALKALRSSTTSKPTPITVPPAQQDLEQLAERKDNESEVLTPGQTKALKDASTLSKNTVAIYDKNGNRKRIITLRPDEIPPTLLEYVKSLCEDPRPIDGCFVCTDGTIVCGNLAKPKKLKGKTP